MIRAIINRIRGAIFPPPPVKTQEKLILVYFFHQRDTDKSLYALWLNGENTNKLITEKHIRNMLPKEQYKYFVNGEIIFEVPEHRVRAFSDEASKGEKSKWMTDPYDGKPKTIKK